LRTREIEWTILLFTTTFYQLRQDRADFNKLPVFVQRYSDVTLSELYSDHLLSVRITSLQRSIKRAYRNLLFHVILSWNESEIMFTLFSSGTRLHHRPKANFKPHEPYVLIESSSTLCRRTHTIIRRYGAATTGPSDSVWPTSPIHRKR
jgi:hypothetical protein